MTDREKILTVADAFELDHEEKGRSLMMGGRRFFFNEEGEIDRIIDYKNHIVATEDSIEARK